MHNQLYNLQASQPQDQDETYVYAINNEYSKEQLYDTVAELSVKVNSYSYLVCYASLIC